MLTSDSFLEKYGSFLSFAILVFSFFKSLQVSLYKEYLCCCKCLLFCCCAHRFYPLFSANPIYSTCSTGPHLLHQSIVHPLSPTFFTFINFASNGRKGSKNSDPSLLKTCYGQSTTVRGSLNMRSLYQDQQPSFQVHFAQSLSVNDKRRVSWGLFTGAYSYHSAETLTRVCSALRKS